MRAHSFLTRLLLGFCFMFGAGAVLSKAAELKFEAKLIWGTDKEHRDDPKLKKVDSDLVDRLQKVFKWKLYYQVTNVTFAVPEKGAKKVTLSEKCDLQVRDLGKPMIEAQLFGEGKLVKNVKRAATQCLVIGGDDRNDTAWFVVLTPK